MNTFKQRSQIFLWADVDNHLKKKRIKNKKRLKCVKLFRNEPAKIKLTQSRPMYYSLQKLPYIPFFRIVCPVFKAVQVKLLFLVKENLFWIQNLCLKWFRKSFKKMIERKSKEPRALSKLPFPSFPTQKSN